MTEPLTAEELDRVRQIAGTAPDTEIGRLFVRLAARATPTPDTLDVERLAMAMRAVWPGWSEEASSRVAARMARATYSAAMRAAYSRISRCASSVVDAVTEPLCDHEWSGPLDKAPTCVKCDMAYRHPRGAEVTEPLNLTPEQALGVALSVAAPTMVMGDAQAAAPDMLAHLNAMGYTLAAPEPSDLIHEAWGVIANAGGGDWSKETPEWRSAAANFSDKMHAATLATPAPDTLDVECPHCVVSHEWPCPTIGRCDEPGCGREATCGWPTRPGGTGPNGGYRRTCGDHMPVMS